MDEELGFYAFIPTEVLHDQEIPANAKLLYAEISALAKKNGYCYAGNDHFVSSWGWSDRTVQRLIKSLEEEGYIRVEQITGKGRRIYLAIQVKLTPDNFVTPPPTILSSPPDNFVAGNKVEEEKGINTPHTPHTPQGGRRVSLPKWDPEGFEKFWDYYRTHARGENRERAVKAWDKLKPDKALIRTMGEALMVQVRSPDWSRGIGIPHLSTWLKDRRWEDQLRENVDPHEPDGMVEERGLPKW